MASILLAADPFYLLKSKHLRSLCLSAWGMASRQPSLVTGSGQVLSKRCRSKPEKQPPEAGVCVSAWRMASVRMAADWFCRRAAFYLQTRESKQSRSVCLGAWGMATHS